MIPSCLPSWGHLHFYLINQDHPHIFNCLFLLIVEVVLVFGVPFLSLFWVGGRNTDFRTHISNFLKKEKKKKNDATTQH